MVKVLTISILLITSIYAKDASDFMKEQMKGFNSYKTSQEEGFKSYQKAQEKAFNDYKKEIGAIWNNPKLSTKESLVSYSKDKKTRADIDFSKEILTVETVASSAEEAKRNLQMALARAVTIDTKTLQETDPLEKRLARIKKPDGVVNAKVNQKPILSTVVFNSKPTQKSVKKYINKNISSSKIKTKKSKIKHAKIYSVVVKLPKDTMIKRSKVYYNEVKKNAIKQKLPISLVYAIMHSESSFNPRARSHIPAYGLMQIVPSSAGRDTYKYLYKKDKLVSGSYLYNSTNNIKMGTGYLHILYYKYLKKIKNDDSRLYCTIAAYNTGAGNIAYAFNKNKNLKKKQKYYMGYAADDINKLTPRQVYKKLMRDLRHDEPKKYLEKVSKRMSSYHKIYGS